ncbi:periplasmic heavy metal sensor [Pseudomonas sp. NPDC090202]|uniref:periplasmic heavy metal sensor n=1 Tax=unclassified Pseudomonas TaxID=196821 RepID=UPI00381ED5A8
MSRTPTRLKTGLVASLLLNVFLVGGIAGGLFQWSNQKAPAAPVIQPGLGKALAQLPDTRRHQLRQMLRETRKENQPLILASRQAHQDVLQRLQAPELDRSALDADLDRARTADITLRSRVDATLAEFAGSLPVDERKTLAQALAARHPALGRSLQKD